MDLTCSLAGGAQRLMDLPIISPPTTRAKDDPIATPLYFQITCFALVYFNKVLSPGCLLGEFSSLCAFIEGLRAQP
jgi:hypothetical protein